MLVFLLMAAVKIVFAVRSRRPSLLQCLHPYLNISFLWSPIVLSYLGAELFTRMLCFVRKEISNILSQNAIRNLRACILYTYRVQGKVLNYS